MKKTSSELRGMAIKMAARHPGMAYDLLGLADRVSADRVSDDRFRPPRQVLQGVDAGELPVECLAIWKYTVEQLGAKFSYGAGTAYWRNKCLKEGVELQAKYMEPGQGATFGPFKIKTGDDIEDWVKQQMRSKGLYKEGVRVAYEWELELHHFEADLAEAKEKVAQHERGIQEGNRVNQRIKWLEGARKALGEAEQGCAAAKAALAAFKEEVVRYEEVKAPVIDFEQQFQSLLLSATVDLSKRAVLTQARAALAKFESEMEGQVRTAGVMDTLWGGIEKAWNWVVSSFHKLTDWVGDLMTSTKRIGQLLDSVS